MHKTMVPIACLAMAFLGAGIAGCETAPRVGNHNLGLNSLDLRKGRTCMVDDRNCLSMMTERPHSCLIDSGHCNSAGTVQWLGLRTGTDIAPNVRLDGSSNIDAK